MDKSQADTWLLKVVDISATSLTFDGKTCQVAAFKRAPSTSSDYFTSEFKIDPSKIGVPQDKVDVIQTGCGGTPFGQFVQINPTTFIAAWNGVFFFFAPVGQTPVVLEPTPKRISFAPGATSATMTSGLLLNGMDRWVIRVFAGQQLSLNATPQNGNVLLIVFGADGDVYQTDHVGSPNFTGVVRSTQDYIVDVRAWGDTAPTYTLQVSIPPLPTIDPHPQPKRISFSPGGTTATVHGSVAANAPDRYVLRVSAGQIMAVSALASQGQVTLMLYGADGTVLVPDQARATSASGNLLSTQDYFIQVNAPVNTTAAYTLQVTIPPLDLQPKRITFPPGGTTATLQGNLAPNAMDRYVLKAAAGQTLTLKVTSPQNQVGVMAWGTDGQMLIPDHADATTWVGKLPATQDYIVNVWSSGTANLSYSLQVTIPPK